MPERFALYFAPAVSSELWRRATIWLGRDAATGAAIEADVGGLDPARRLTLTHAARRYGFHATLKAPMRLDPRLAPRDLDRALHAFASVTPPLPVGRLELRAIEGFLALVPAHQTAELTDFAQKIVADFDGFRAPPTAEERARRLASTALTPRQVALLDQFGYPYVAEQFRFHMTLTDRLAADEQASVMAALESWFAPVLDEDVLLDRVALFREAESGAPFLRQRDYLLTPRGQDF